MIWVNLAQTCDTFFVIPISFTAPEIFRYIFSLTDCNYTLVILVNFPNKSFATRANLGENHAALFSWFDLWEFFRNDIAWWVALAWQSQCWSTFPTKCLFGINCNSGSLWTKVMQPTISWFTLLWFFRKWCSMIEHNM